jgi:nitrite reductase (NAD(P)H)
MEAEPALTLGIEPVSGQATSPPPSPGLKGANVSNADWNDAEANALPRKVEELKEGSALPENTQRKRIVVVGLGMVGIAFMWVLHVTEGMEHADFVAEKS